MGKKTQPKKKPPQKKISQSSTKTGITNPNLNHDAVVTGEGKTFIITDPNFTQVTKDFEKRYTTKSVPTQGKFSSIMDSVDLKGNLKENAITSGIEIFTKAFFTQPESIDIEEDIATSKEIDNQFQTKWEAEVKYKDNSDFIKKQEYDIKNKISLSHGGTSVVVAYAKNRIIEIFNKNKNIIPKVIITLNNSLSEIYKKLEEKGYIKPISTLKPISIPKPFHSGGLILGNEGLVVDDLQPNERIIKALVGERVLSIEQNKAFEKMMFGSGGVGGGQDTHITNNYTYPIDMDSFREALARPENGEIIKGFNATNVKYTGRAW